MGSRVAPDGPATPTAGLIPSLPNFKVGEREVGDMRQNASQTVNPDVVKSSCLALIETLARDASLSDNQITPALEALNAEMLEPMFCVTHLWAADSLARLTGCNQSLEHFVAALPQLDKTQLATLAITTQDESSALFLATALDAMRLMGIAIERNLEALR